MAPYETVKLHAFNGRKLQCHEGTVFYRIHNNVVYFAIGDMIPNYIDIPKDINEDTRFANCKTLTWADTANGKLIAKHGWNYIKRRIDSNQE